MVMIHPENRESSLNPVIRQGDECADLFEGGLSDRKKVLNESTVDFTTNHLLKTVIQVRDCFVLSSWKR